jgi:AhpD family alkylhydroperoxidase
MSLEGIQKQQPAAITALYRLRHEVFKDGALSFKEKELIAVALMSVMRCEECLEIHAQKAKEAGATNDELREALLVAMYLGGPTQVIWSEKIDEIIGSTPS